MINFLDLINPNKNWQNIVIAKVKIKHICRSVILLSCLFSATIGMSNSDNTLFLNVDKECVKTKIFDAQQLGNSITEGYSDLPSFESTMQKFCIELDFDTSEISCYNADDARIHIEYVTSGASVTVNGEPFDSKRRYGPGRYHLEARLKVENDEECYFSEWIEFIEPEPVFADITHTNVSCPGMNDGTITVYNLSLGADYVIQAEGAVGPYLDGENLLSGTYWVTVFVASQGPPDKNEGYKNDCIYTYAVQIDESEIDYYIKPYFENIPYCSDSPYALKRNQLLVKFDAPGYVQSWSINEKALKNGWTIDFTTEHSGWGEVAFTPGVDEAVFTLRFTNEEGCRKEYYYTVQSPDC